MKVTVAEEDTFFVCWLGIQYLVDIQGLTPSGTQVDGIWHLPPAQLSLPQKLRWLPKLQSPGDIPGNNKNKATPPPF
jgi:hypothetical protein